MDAALDRIAQIGGAGVVVVASAVVGASLAFCLLAKVVFRACHLVVAGIGVEKNLASHFGIAGVISANIFIIAIEWFSDFAFSIRASFQSVAEIIIGTILVLGTAGNGLCGNNRRDQK